MKALILEDNLSLSESLKRLLSGQGWEVEANPYWSRVSQSAKNNNFQVIVMDILLPEKKGFEILKILEDKKVSSKIAVISGFAGRESAFKGISEDFKKQCHFFKKPIDEKALLAFIKTPQDYSGLTLNNEENPLIASFFEKAPPSKKLSFYFPQSKSFNSEELVFLLFYAHLKSFTGEITIKISNNQPSYVQFHKGKIIKLISNSKQSFFGELLIEHGLSLPKDIESILNDQKGSKKIGEQLVEKQLLNPYMLNFMLKEQIKIRLSELMSHSSFQVDILEEKEETEQLPRDIETDFNEVDFIDWLADSVQTELKKDFLKKLYSKIRHYNISKVSKCNSLSILQKKFLSQYNDFFQSLKDEESISKIMKDSNKTSYIQLICFGLLTKSIYLKSAPGQERKASFKKLEEFLDDILLKSKDELVESLMGSSQLPEQAQENYNAVVKKIHIDSLPKNITPEIKQKAEKAFIKIKEVQQVLIDKDQRDKYFSGKEKKDFLSIMNSYQQGISCITMGKYQEGFNILSKIKDSKAAPRNLELYLLWAEIKKDNLDFVGKDKNVAVQVRKKIDSCPIHLRTSYLFWFLKGVFYLKVKQYEDAEKFFSKTLSIQKNFMPAKKELATVKQIIGQKEKMQAKSKGLFSFFKKSG